MEIDTNYYQSSRAMDSAGAMSIFSSLIEKYNMRYSHYIGEGDNESFKKVVDSQPFGDDLKPVKLECVGHLQNRFRYYTLKVKKQHER